MKPFRPGHMLLSILCAIFSTAFQMWTYYNEIGPLNFPEVIFMILGILVSIFTIINLIICCHGIAEPWEYKLDDKD